MIVFFISVPSMSIGELWGFFRENRLPNHELFRRVRRYNLPEACPQCGNDFDWFAGGYDRVRTERRMLTVKPFLGHATIIQYGSDDCCGRHKQIFAQIVHEHLKRRLRKAKIPFTSSIV